MDNVRWDENRLAHKIWDVDVRNIVWDMRYHLDTDRKPSVARYYLDAVARADTLVDRYLSLWTSDVAQLVF